MMNSILATLTSIFAIATVSGHMAVVDPTPRDYKYNKNVKPENINYDLVAPVSKFGCSQFHKTAPVITYKPGQRAKITIGGEAPHNGGSCQIGLSFDGEKFISLRDDVGHCLNDGYDYEFTIPEGTPNGEAVIAWAWINRTGNREYYFNCIDVNIEGGSDGAQLTGRSISIANLPSYTEIPEGEAGIPKTQALYDSAETVTISKGNGGYPVKVETEIGKSRSGQTQYPVKQEQQQPQQGNQTPQQPQQDQSPAPAPAPIQNQTPAPAPSTPKDSQNPRNKPLVERMKCTPGPPTCEDDVTYIQCAPNDYAYRKFCPEGFVCNMKDDIYNCLLKH